MNGRMRHMGTRMITLAVAAIGVVVIAGTALAGHQTSGVKSYTGCLVTGDGVMIKIKEGNEPRSACTGGQVEAHFSGGDITRISVTGALTMPGGATSDDNGEVTIGLKPEFTLPSGCDSGQVAKWNGTAWVCRDDNDTRYAAGAGLDLDVTETPDEFSILPGYRLPGKACTTAGHFSRGFDSSGNIQCAAPTGPTLTAVSDTQDDPGGEGIPDDDAYHTYASVTPAAGTYLVLANGAVYSEGNVDQFSGVSCSIQSGGTTAHTIPLNDDNLDNAGFFPFSLSAITSVSSGALELACVANDGADGLQLFSGRIIALKVG